MVDLKATALSNNISLGKRRLKGDIVSHIWSSFNESPTKKVRLQSSVPSPSINEEGVESLSSTADSISYDGINEVQKSNNNETADDQLNFLMRVMESSQSEDVFCDRYSMRWLLLWAPFFT